MNTKLKALVIFCVVASVVILAHQLTFWGRIDIVDMLHHEFFAFVLLAFALGIVVTVFIDKPKKKK